MKIRYWIALLVLIIFVSPYLIQYLRTSTTFGEVLEIEIDMIEEIEIVKREYPDDFTFEDLADNHFAIDSSRLTVTDANIIDQIFGNDSLSMPIKPTNKPTAGSDYNLHVRTEDESIRIYLNEERLRMNEDHDDIEDENVIYEYLETLEFPDS